MTAGISELERAVSRFLAAADEPYWDRSRPELLDITYQLVSVTCEIERLREQDALDDQIDAYCSMIQNTAEAARCRLAELEAGGEELSDLGFSVAQAKVHARSLRDALIGIRGGSSNLSESYPVLLQRVRAAPPSVAGRTTSQVRPRTATAAARRTIMLAVRVLPAEHRDRYREEWTAIVLDRPRVQQLRHAVSFLVGAYVTRRALLEPGPAPVGDVETLPTEPT